MHWKTNPIFMIDNNISQTTVCHVNDMYWHEWLVASRSGSCFGQALALMKYSIKSLIDTLGENDFVNVANVRFQHCPGRICGWWGIKIRESGTFHNVLKYKLQCFNAVGSATGIFSLMTLLDTPTCASPVSFFLALHHWKMFLLQLKGAAFCTAASEHSKWALLNYLLHFFS